MIKRRRLGLNIFNYFRTLVPLTNRSKEAFTIIELLVVIGILSVIATTTVLVINPIELLKQSRDSNRIEGINHINKAIDLYLTGGGQPPMQDQSVYISLPDSSPTCSNHPNLPKLDSASGWHYVCATAANYRSTINGWIPINFQGTGIAGFSSLPIDPINNEAHFYTYIPKRSITAFLESNKQLKNIALVDGGYDPSRYEIGLSLDLWAQATGLVSWWTFDGNSLNDSSGSNNGSLAGSPAPIYSSAGKINGAFVFANAAGYVSLGNPASLQITGSQTISMWLYPTDQSARRNPYAKAYGGEGTITQEIGGGLNYYYGTSGANNVPYQGFGAGTTIPLNQWTNITLVRDLINMRLYWYKNGVQTTTTPANYPAATASTMNALIGYGYTSNYAGTIDDVRIYNRALSPAEILANFKAAN